MVGHGIGNGNGNGCSDLYGSGSRDLPGRFQGVHIALLVEFDDFSFVLFLGRMSQESFEQSRVSMVLLNDSFRLWIK